MAIGGLNFTQAVFESTSGWTTTGLSVVDVSVAPRLVLLYRSLMQLAGGAGLAVIMLSALAGPAGTGLSAAEGRADQLVPNVRRSAKLVVTIYSGYVIFGGVALNLAGMGWFDALNHAFAAISTGGFSTRAESIGSWGCQLRLAPGAAHPAIRSK
jgi:trk system potassium uptake protein TrkH